MTLLARLETPASWAMGGATLSAAFSVGKRVVSQLWPELDSVPAFTKMLPSAQPLLKALGWGASFGFYQERTVAFLNPHAIQDVFACYTGAAGLASETMVQIVGGDYWDYMDMSKPFALLYSTAFVAKQLAPLFITPRIQFYP